MTFDELSDKILFQTNKTEAECGIRPKYLWVSPLYFSILNNPTHLHGLKVDVCIWMCASTIVLSVKSREEMYEQFGDARGMEMLNANSKQ